MRSRLLSAVMAGTYALAFVLVCLSGCLAPAKTTHACCADDPALRAPAADCCKVVSGVSGTSPAVAGLSHASYAALPRVDLVDAPHRAGAARPAPSPSPPLVLRV